MKEEDILARQSRPQRHSTFVPKTRDWRYDTGVFQHDDNENSNERSAWDALDYDYQVVGTKRSRRGSGISNGSGTELSRTGYLARTPESAVSMTFSEGGSKAVIKLGPPRNKARTAKKSKWMQISRYKPSGEQSLEGEEHSDYKVYSLTVKLCFSSKLIIQDAQSQTEIPGEHKNSQAPDTPYAPAPTRTAETFNPPASSMMTDSPNAPATTRTTDTKSTPHNLNPAEFVQKIPPFQRSWVDETEQFNMVDVHNRLQQLPKEVKEMGPNYAWYTNAVPINAIFPPGILMSAKEVMAYYPHHVRWKDMMLRLTHNDYRGTDIIGMQAFFRGPSQRLTHPGQMNQFQRDTVKTNIPGFKIESYKGRRDPDLSTSHIKPGRYISERVSGFIVPSYDDLLSGLRYFPSGLDARVLTECLAWYITVRDMFTPRLQINVLHTQALIRALRVPIKGYGPQNLDYLALMEWREKGKFEARRMGEIIVTSASAVEDTDSGEDGGRSRIRMNLDSEDVSLDVTIPIRHVLIFPFVALHGVIGEGLKMGIKKAEARAKARGIVPKTTTTEDQPGTNRMKPPAPSPKTTPSFTTPPRPLTTANLRTLPPAHKKPAPAATSSSGLATASRITTGTRQVHPSPHPQSQSYAHSSFATPGPPSTSSHHRHPPNFPTLPPLHNTPATAPPPPSHTQQDWETHDWYQSPFTPAPAHAQPPYYSAPPNTAHGHGSRLTGRYLPLPGPGFASPTSFAPTSHDAYARRPQEYEDRRGADRYGHDDRSRGSEARGESRGGSGAREYGYGYGHGYGHGEEYGYNGYDGRYDGYDNRQGQQYHHDDHHHGGWNGDRRSSDGGGGHGGDGYRHGSVYRR
ncbi:hypothetical protein PTNB73_01608 [Pyrenophora teres f. teres]|uniref:Uncharacterized protein n=2 Tax=Pyrenophora teres f. teres TaxID=97479 RepID=E3RES5_PYRTT|nr:hypothetical protein PTT_04952 [Pyrenophora teres f. teres 0-1]KAE8845628.1 hypothetical protein HRS9139_00195 [Pyrenophora teres f. teres]KAE8847765.1 hypothetical protein PTNB85_01608 [Pyrenophora teres f. teres]KAE8854078.1 hypothetical protein HRS9122_01070 [Pyrenophora teres f. teres]KAE8867692.1 hypothetical protein PTNB29_01603 [Pyrenophora teres f. teres]